MLVSPGRPPDLLPHPCPPAPVQGSLGRRSHSRAEGNKDRPASPVSLPTEKAAGPGADSQPAPPWVTTGRQKRRGASEQTPSQEDKPGVRTLKSEPGRPARTLERAQVLGANTPCPCGHRRGRGWDTETPHVLHSHTGMQSALCSCGAVREADKPLPQWDSPPLPAS